MSFCKGLNKYWQLARYYYWCCWLLYENDNVEIFWIWWCDDLMMATYLSEYCGVMTWWWQHICLSVYYYQGLVFIKIQYEDMNMVLQQLSVRPDQSVIKWSYDKILSITCMLWCSLSNVVFSKEEMVRRWLYTFVRVGNVCPFIWYGIAISVNNKRNVCHILEMVSPILVFHLVVFNNTF